jgi:tetratricopeptide (TPR) repeat protein
LFGMTKSAQFRFCAGVAVVALIGVVGLVGSARAAEPTDPTPQLPADKLDPNGFGAPKAGPKSDTGRLPGTTQADAKSLAQQPLPNTAAERSKLLANLYAYLATAEDEKQAQAITPAIERLWLFANSDTIALLMDRSARAVEAKNTDLALKLLDAVVDLAPDYAEGWNRRAYVHYLKNDVERMVGDLRRCLALEPNHYRAMEGLAQVLRETGQKKAAYKAFQRLLEIHPNSSGALDALKELGRDVDGQKT